MLVEDCMTHNLSEKESLSYIEKRHKKVSKMTYHRYKDYINSDESLNIYFNEHARIGFVIDQRDRKNEMNSINSQLLRRWKNLTGRENTDVDQIIRLSHAIVSVNKRLEEISLSNPVISKIKAKVDLVDETDKISRENSFRN